ncbi:MAG: 4Fe-4S cluster-binding domain-containing protein [Chloroflexi bacterium]|nr:4Fe-4S cluster-binding domain-containing protein [Chloroflexota bacterium]
MKLTGLHLLLTYQCTLECDHCFVWGSPSQHGAMTIEIVQDILEQAKSAGCKSIYFEGGEPFLLYVVLARGVQRAFELGFQVGIVSNAYWATSVPDAVEWLRPFAGKLADLSLSSDLYHWSERLGQLVENAHAAAEQLDIPVGYISIAQPEARNAPPAFAQLPERESGVMFRGRAAEKLAARARQEPWHHFERCCHEDLRDPGRVHVDAYGNLHVCDGIVIGNLFHKPLREICRTYDPYANPITAALLEGGPAELVRSNGLAHQEEYADACHLCYAARLALRERFPEILAPDQMYGVN